MSIPNPGTDALVQGRAVQELNDIGAEIQNGSLARHRGFTPVVLQNNESHHLFKHLEKIRKEALKALETTKELLEQIDPSSPTISSFQHFFNYYSKRLCLVACEIDHKMLEVFQSGQFVQADLDSLLDEEKKIQAKIADLKKRKKTFKFDTKMDFGFTESTATRILIRSLFIGHYESAQQSSFSTSCQFLHDHKKKGKKVVKFLQKQAELLRVIDCLSERALLVQKLEDPTGGKKALVAFQTALLQARYRELFDTHKKCIKAEPNSLEKMNDEVLGLLRGNNVDDYGIYVRPYLLSLQAIEFLMGDVERSHIYREQLLEVLQKEDASKWLEEKVKSAIWSTLPKEEVVAIAASLHFVALLSTGDEITQERNKELISILQNAAFSSCLEHPSSTSSRFSPETFRNYITYTEVARVANVISLAGLNSEVNGCPKELLEHKSIKNHKFVFKTIEAKYQSSVAYLRKCRIIALACIQYSQVEKLLGARLDIRLLRIGLSKQSIVELNLSILESLKAYWRAIFESKTFSDLLISLMPIMGPLLVVASVFVLPTVMSLFPLIHHVMGDLSFLILYMWWVGDGFYKHQRFDYLGPFTQLFESNGTVRSNIINQMKQEKLERKKKDRFEEIKEECVKNETYDTFLYKWLEILYAWGKLPSSIVSKVEKKDFSRDADSPQVRLWVDEYTSKLKQDYDTPTSYIMDVMEHRMLNVEELKKFVTEKSNLRDETDPKWKKLYEMAYYEIVESRIKSKLKDLLIRRHQELFLKYPNEDRYFSSDQYAAKYIDDIQMAIAKIDADDSAPLVIEKMAQDPVSLDNLRRYSADVALFNEGTNQEDIKIVKEFISFRDEMKPAQKPQKLLPSGRPLYMLER